MMLDIIADASVRSAVLAAIGLLVLLAARKRSAAFQHAVWTVALCAMLLMPAVTMLAPAVPVRVLAPAAAVTIPVAPPVAVPVIRSAAPSPQPARSRTDWPAIASALYGAVALSMLLRLATGWIALRRLVRHSAAVQPGVFECAGITVPLTVASRILLPCAWREWDGVVLDAALAHERAHVRRHDWLVGLIAAVNRSVFWLNPLAWWLERRIAVLAEEACDDAALLAVEDRESYARVLLDMAHRASTSGGRVFAGAPAMASHVTRRIDRVLEESFRASHGLSRAAWTALLVASLPVFYGAAAARLAPAQGLRPTPPGPNETIEVMSEGRRLSPEDLERHLESDPEDLEARSILISHYFQNAMREPWLKHVYWMIENHPEAPVHYVYALTLISPQSVGLGGPAEYERAKELWLRAAEQHWDDPRILQTAARGVAEGDFEAAARLYQRARELAPTDRQLTSSLALMYARLANTDPKRIQAELDQSSDADLVGITGQLLKDDPSLAGFGEHLLERARTLDPNWNAAPARIRVDPSVQERKLMKRVDPVYPPLARQARIQGTVRFEVTIGTDGSVANLRLISGHPLLVTAAQEAVRQWEYEPTLLNGSPVEVVTHVDVPFLIDAKPQATGGVVGGVVGGVPGGVVGGVPGGVVGGVPGGVVGGVIGGVPSSTSPEVQRIRVAAAVQAAKLQHRPDPVYPPLARQARQQGTVRFTVVIGPDGRVSNMQLISGHPLLVPAAQDAVRQSEYRPTLLNGSPVEVVTQVDVKFALPPQDSER